MSVLLPNVYVDNKEIKIVKDLYFVSIIYSHGECRWKVQRQRLRRAAMKELENILKCKDVLVKTRWTPSVLRHFWFLCTDLKPEQWRNMTGEKLFEMWCWRRGLWILLTPRKINKRICFFACLFACLFDWNIFILPFFLKRTQGGLGCG